jgi:hypothetical protein
MRCETSAVYCALYLRRICCSSSKLAFLHNTANSNATVMRSSERMIVHRDTKIEHRFWKIVKPRVDHSLEIRGVQIEEDLNAIDQKKHAMFFS